MKLAITTGKPSMSLYYAGKGDFIHETFIIEVADEIIPKQVLEAMKEDNPIDISEITIVKD